MLGALLLMVLVSTDTTARVAPLLADTLQVDRMPAGVVNQDTLPALSFVVPAFRIDRPVVTPVQPLSLTFADTTVTDTTVKKRRPALVSYSDWYGRRLAVHRTLTWTMIPLFAVSYYTGERLARDGRVNSPYAVRALHPYAATGATVLFGVNTFTGLWNLWDARHDAEGRKRRIAHSVLFMIADAGFAYGGSIGKRGREDPKIRDLHRNIALGSMGISYVSAMMMLLGGK